MLLKKMFPELENTPIGELPINTFTCKSQFYTEKSSIYVNYYITAVNNDYSYDIDRDMLMIAISKDCSFIKTFYVKDLLFQKFKKENPPKEFINMLYLNRELWNITYMFKTH